MKKAASPTLLELQLQQQLEELRIKYGVLEQRNRELELQVQEYQKLLFKKKAGSKKGKKDRLKKKRGAPVGHPGTTRKKPDRIDEQIDVHLQQCPHCQSKDLSPCKDHEDHIQEEIVLPQVKVTCFRHHLYYCKHCKEKVQGVGVGELTGSDIGPRAKSVAAFLHYQMKVPYRKIQTFFREVFNLHFVPSSAPGFDQQIRVRGSPLYEKMKELIRTQPLIHVDETGWRLDGANSWLWCFASKDRALYHIDPSRGGKGLYSILGESYSGVIISDFLAAYNQFHSRKQRCLVHLLRLTDKWRIYFQEDPKEYLWFSQLKKITKKIIALNRKILAHVDLPKKWIDPIADLIASLRRTLQSPRRHPKAEKFRNKLLRQFQELITCLELKNICAHHNYAERLLRDNVILRKITFGNRSEKGVQNHQVLMSLIQTARLRLLNPLDFLHSLLTRTNHATAALFPSPSTSAG